MIDLHKNGLASVMYLRPLKSPRQSMNPSGLLSGFVLISTWLAVSTFCLSMVHAQTGSEYEEMMDEEMDDYEYEEDEYGGYGGSSSRRGASTGDVVASRLSDVLTSALKSTNFASLTDPEAAPPVLAGPVLLNDAAIAYAKGDFPLAMKLYFGHIVAEYDKAETQLQMVKYSPLMRRPTWSLRWGVSFDLRGDDVDPTPIEDTGPSQNGRIAMGMGMGMGGMEMEDDYDMEQEMMADMQEQMRAQMEMDMEMEEDDYEMEMMNGSMSGRRRNEAPAAAPTPLARLTSLERTMLDEDTATRLQDHLGVVATIVGEEFDKRYAQGDFGRALTDVTPESGTPEAVSGEFIDLMESVAQPMPLWRPGMVFVGEGPSDDNVAIARKAGLDVLLHFDIYLKQRGDWVQNVSRCKLLSVPDGKTLGASGKIDSLEYAQQSRGKGTSSRGFVDEQMENFWAIIDRATVTTDLPQLTPEVAKRRIGQLLASGGGRNLRTLAEIRLFQSQRLLTDDDVLKAFDIVGGDEALQLLFGSEDQRLTIARNWAGGFSSSEE